MCIRDRLPGGALHPRRSCSRTLDRPRTTAQQEEERLRARSPDGSCPDRFDGLTSPMSGRPVSGPPAESLQAAPLSDEPTFRMTRPMKVVTWGRHTVVLPLCRLIPPLPSGRERPVSVGSDQSSISSASASHRASHGPAERERGGGERLGLLPPESPGFAGCLDSCLLDPCLLYTSDAADDLL